MRTSLASRLFGEAAVRAPAPLLLNWSPQNLGAPQLHDSVKTTLSEPRESLRPRRSASITSLYLCSFFLFFFFYYPIPLHLQIAIGRVNHTRRDKEEQTVEKMAGTNGRRLRPAYWVIGFEPLILSDLFWIKAIKCPHIERITAH